MEAINKSIPFHYDKEREIIYFLTLETDVKDDKFIYFQKLDEKEEMSKYADYKINFKSTSFIDLLSKKNRKSNLEMLVLKIYGERKRINYGVQIKYMFDKGTINKKEETKQFLTTIDNVIKPTTEYKPLFKDDKKYDVFFKSIFEKINMDSKTLNNSGHIFNKRTCKEFLYSYLFEGQTIRGFDSIESYLINKNYSHGDLSRRTLKSLNIKRGLEGKVLMALYTPEAAKKMINAFVDIKYKKVQNNKTT